MNPSARLKLGAAHTEPRRMKGRAISVHAVLVRESQMATADNAIGTMIAGGTR